MRVTVTARLYGSDRAAGSGPNAAEAARGRGAYRRASGTTCVPLPRTSRPEPGRPLGPTAREGGRKERET
jgi:hypothetical protein